MASDDTPVDPADTGGDPTRRADPGDFPTRRAEPEDSSQVRGLLPGRRLFGRYVLESLAGRGGMGVVWKARDERLERVVALKLLPELVAGDAEAVRDLLRETKRCLELTHPNIVRVHDLEQDGSLAAISMEYVDGESLAKRKTGAPGGCLKLEELRPLIEQLCMALGYAHRVAKVVHRDLKPANLLLAKDGQLKVTDFGIARSLSDTHTRLTGRVGNTSGTLLYMSPQQLMGDEPSASDDLYAFGATLYELLTGRPPFHTGDVATQVRDVIPKPVNARLAALGLDPVPANWEETIQACLAKDRNERPKSADEVARRLFPTTDFTDGAEKKKAGKAAAGAEPPRGKRQRNVALIAGAIVVLGVAGYLLWHRASASADQVAGRQGDPGGGAGLLRPETTQGRSEAAPLQRPESAQDGPSAASSPTGAAQPKGFAVTVDPPDVGARLWLGQLAAVEIKDGRALLNDLPDGEQELTVQAPGYQPFTTRVMVKDGRGSVEARLVPVRGAITVTARPGTEVTAVDERGREMPLGTIPPAGMLDVTNQLKVGRYTLKLEHADCAAVTVPGVQLVTGRTITVAPEQALLPGELRVSSVPTGAEVRVNGTVAGSTPATISNQPTGQVLKVEVFQHGHRRMEESVTLKPREVRTVNFGTLPVESGRIELRAADPSLRFDRAQIVVDGKSIEAAGIVGNGPFAFDGFEVGSHTVEITHADYEPWQRTVTVRDHDTVEVMVDLKPRLGTVACETTPAGARVIVNGGERHESALGGGTQAESLTPLRGALRPGPYALRFERDGYKSVVRNVTVVANRTAEVSVALEKISSAEEGQAWTVPDLNLKMMYVRPGTFTMGSANGDRDEKPQTRVTLTRSFWLGRTEVTQGQWEALMGSNPSHFKSAARDAPVEQVSWDDAMQFCRKLSERERSAGRLQDGYQYMLPTEAQWEFACRAGTTGDFAGGLDAMVWYNQNSGLATHPVAQKQANAWGLCDMHGNVWEWCLDWYGAYPGGSVTDPTGPSTGSSRIIRGGGWGETARNCRSAGRFKNVPVYRNTGLGFRVALVSQVNQ